VGTIVIRILLIALILDVEILSFHFWIIFCVKNTPSINMWEKDVQLVGAQSPFSHQKPFVEDFPGA
jgi:hypothetical protein